MKQHNRGGWDALIAIKRLKDQGKILPQHFEEIKEEFTKSAKSHIETLKANLDKLKADIDDTTAKDVIKAIGVKDAVKAIGVYYFFIEDYKEAAVYCGAAAQMGDKEALEAVGLLQSYDQISQEDFSQIQSGYYQYKKNHFNEVKARAGALKDPFELRHQGKIHEDEKDYEMAIVFYFEATKMGDKRALEALEKLKTTGILSEEDFEELQILLVESQKNQLEELKMEADISKNPSALREFGGILEIEGDYDKALIFYTEAAKRGDHKAMLAIKELQVKGRATPEIIEGAQGLYNKFIQNKMQASKAEAEETEGDLALYSKGCMAEMEQDYENAAIFYLEGTKRGDRVAMDALTRLNDEGKIAPVEIEKIQDEFNRIADNKLEWQKAKAKVSQGPQEYLILGDRYADKKDYRGALSAYREGIKLGYHSSMRAIKRLFDTGRITQKALEAAEKEFNHVQADDRLEALKKKAESSKNALDYLVLGLEYQTREDYDSALETHRLGAMSGHDDAKININQIRMLKIFGHIPNGRYQEIKKEIAENNVTKLTKLVQSRAFRFYPTGMKNSYYSQLGKAYKKLGLYESAMEWLGKAAKMGHVNAFKDIIAIQSKVSFPEFDQIQADFLEVREREFKNLESKATHAKGPYFPWKLANEYQGRHELDKAAFWYGKAAKMGHESSMKALKEIKEMGKVEITDFEEIQAAYNQSQLPYLTQLASYLPKINFNFWKRK